MAATDATHLGLVMLAAAAGGVINSIAGGGTLLTFPALIGLGIPGLAANATSTVALWPGAAGSIVGYRRELAGMRPWAIRFAVPSVLGGLAGALLLLRTSAERFEQLMPWLVIGASALFVIQRPLMAWIRAWDIKRGVDLTLSEPSETPSLKVLLYQFGVGVYGGYFGAGIGILMLAALGFMGFTNIHKMNGLKNWGGLCTNVVAAATFAVSGIVIWPVAGAMAVGAIAGGYGGSLMAQRVPQQRVRQAITFIGFASGIWLLIR
ncbi:MAG: sulfite exporter TauE/SafE family protein, partial [Gemmatimonadota bacterium]